MSIGRLPVRAGLGDCNAKAAPESTILGRGSWRVCATQVGQTRIGVLEHTKHERQVGQLPMDSAVVGRALHTSTDKEITCIPSHGMVALALIDFAAEVLPCEPWPP